MTYQEWDLGNGQVSFSIEFTPNDVRAARVSESGLLQLLPGVAAHLVTRRSYTNCSRSAGRLRAWFGDAEDAMSIMLAFA